MKVCICFCVRERVGGNQRCQRAEKWDQQARDRGRGQEKIDKGWRGRGSRGGSNAAGVQGKGSGRGGEGEEKREGKEMYRSRTVEVSRRVTRSLD